MAALGVVRVWFSTESAVFRKGATCWPVAENEGPALPFRGFFLRRLGHGWLIPLAGFVAGKTAGSVGDGSSNRGLSLRLPESDQNPSPVKIHAGLGLFALKNYVSLTSGSCGRVRGSGFWRVGRLAAQPLNR